MFSFTDHLQRAAPVSSTTITDRITANVSSTPSQMSIPGNCASFRQQHDFLQTICVPQCIFSAFPYARQFHSCNFLSNYKSYSIDRNLQVRRRHNRPVLDEGPWAYAKLHSEQASFRTTSTCFIPYKFHSTVPTRTLPLDFDLRERTLLIFGFPRAYRVSFTSVLGSSPSSLPVYVVCLCYFHSYCIPF